MKRSKKWSSAAWLLSASLAMQSTGVGFAAVPYAHSLSQENLPELKNEGSLSSGNMKLDINKFNNIQTKTSSDAKKDDPSDRELEKASSSDGKKTTGTDEWEDFYAPDHKKGGFELTIGNAFPLDKGKKFEVSILDEEEKTVKQGSVKLTPENQSKTLILDSIPNGEYTLHVEADGFADFDQEVIVDSDIKSGAIYTDVLNIEDIEYTASSNHPGLMLLGDVNGDGQITAEDKEALLDAMAGTKKRSLLARIFGKSTAPNADLNGDGNVDLIDFQHFTSSYTKVKENIHTDASFTSRINDQAIAVQNGENTAINGKIEDILTENGSVTLKSTKNEPISEENPVEIGIALQSKEQEENNECVQVEQIAITTGDSGIKNGVVILETEDDGSIEYQIEDGQLVELSRGFARVISRNAEESDRIVIDLGGQIAVKRVIIRVTAATGNNNLVNISQVEFLNDMENRIPEPEMDIPKNVSAKGSNKAFTLTWDASKNVTGYEVEISYKNKKEVIRAATNSLKVTSFQNEELINREVYEVRVQAVNGSWSSGYGAAIEAIPKLEGRPDAPDYVKTVGGYQKIAVSWKDMEDTESYLVYWREKGTDTYTKSESVKTNSYEITNLKDKTTYEVYVTGVNELGESNPSLISEATTTVITPAILPEYKLINESNGKGVLAEHIVSAEHGLNRGEMVGSALDPDDGKSALGVFDNDYSSYFHVADWDEFGVYKFDNRGIYVTFDQEYTMNYITFAEIEDVYPYLDGSFYYYNDEESKYCAAEVSTILQKTDKNGRKYYAMKLAKPVTASKVRVGFSRRYGNYGHIVIAEMRFYHYDSLEDDVMELYADALHTELKTGVTLEQIEELQKRLDTVDSKSEEYHPEREAIQKEIDNAKGLLDSSLRESLSIHPQITAAQDGHLGFSGLNAWQPLGVSAYAGEQIVIYVGHNSKNPGDSTNLKLVATQYHAESKNVKTDVATLKVGRNEVTIPKLQSLTAESGGALYVEYTGNNADDQYAVRVSGGVKIPVLDLYGITDDTKRVEKITAYINELESHTAALEETHKKSHVEDAGAGAGANCDYDAKNCIADATDIMMDSMMYSVSGTQILKGLSGSTEKKAEQLNESLKAMEQMMHLFYQHKGLSNAEGATKNDRLPAQHLNIRYMRMFAGAFMYAGGNHIGIEYDSVPGLSTAVPVVSDANGKYQSGNLFGWGIAHEIGHNINQSSYAVAEITNNYFAQLTTARDSNASTRFQYENVWEKVTSGTIGRSSNQATQLAMYWQLHVAYDRDYNFKTYDSYNDQFENLFYARVDSYARDLSRAPKPDGIELTLEGDAEQKFMRLACAAAEKDLTEYFTRWGVIPNEGTKKYAGQFDKEERAIYYLTDDARVYEIEHGTSNKIQDKAVILDSSSAVVSDSIPNEVTLTLNSNVSSDVLLGYEIARYTYEGGQATREVVGFAPAKESSSVTYKDHVTTLNNRVVTYEAIAVDNFGYYSEAKEIGAVRISHDGSMDKSLWTVTTNMTSKADAVTDADEQDPCDPVKEPAITRILDNDYTGNTYVGAADQDAVITISMNKKEAVSALKYTAASGTQISSYKIEISEDGSTWTKVREGSFENKTGSQTVYFQNEDKDPWVATYDAMQVRLTAVGTAGKEVAVTELDILGPSGDSISFGVKSGETNTAVGILSADYIYEAESGSKIPKGSLVFMGSYKGNPAYNSVLLYDDAGNIVGGRKADGSTQAEQIILAKVPENGMLGETSDGTWIYWIEPESDGSLPKLSGKVRAELYRVDNALTNEGQRMVSDTMPLMIPETFEKIELGNKN